MRAIMVVRIKEMGLLLTYKVFEVPKSTLMIELNVQNKLLSNYLICYLVGNFSCLRTSKMHKFLTDWKKEIVWPYCPGC
jgi:hypothetical protein